jgi:hypothetical protein
MAGAYCLKALGALLIGCGAGGGYCVFGAGVFCYDALYAPLVYSTFLHGFFSAEELDTDLMLYAEMLDADFI